MVPHLLALSKRIARWRFFRFGVVGASGTVVNLTMLYLAQEWLFAAVEPAAARLNMSLALAIFVASVNNFTWNRAWTWHDRKVHTTTPVVLQYGQYALSSWLGILVQVTLTNLFSTRIHYLIANAIAISIASLFNFVANDMWTFGRLKMWLRRRG